LPPPINHVKPWICEQEGYIWVLGTFLCHKYIQLNFRSPFCNWTGKSTPKPVPPSWGTRCHRVQHEP
jgi:hypothetical protein